MHWTPSRLSRILTGKSHISVSEADRLNGLFRHDENESAYYIALTRRRHTQDRELRVRFSDEMQRIRTAGTSIA
jgi:plasmid maintenance system antidote protein VapI